MIQQYDLLEYDRTQTEVASDCTSYEPKRLLEDREGRGEMDFGFGHRKTKACFRGPRQKVESKKLYFIQALYALKLTRTL